MQAGRVVSFEKGEVIWFMTTANSHCYAVGSGFVKMSRSTPAGQEVTLEIFGPGQLFGLNGILDGSGCPLQATALTKVQLLRIPAENMKRVFAANVAWKDAMIQRLLARIRERLDLMARTMSSRVEERIAAILLLLAESYGKREGEGIILDVPLTRSDIGELAGTTTETTIRVMSRWQKEGLIETERQTITLVDLESIEGLFNEI